MQLSEDGRILIKVDPTDIQSDGHFNVPDTVSEIGQEAFHNCTGLTEVTFPEGLTVIGSSAFSYCTGLTQVIFLKV